MIRHMRLDIKGCLMNWKTKELKGMFKTNDGHDMSALEAKETLLLELSKGHNFIPFGDCPGFDPVLKGCPGHEKAGGK
jgi:hypothetical protein